MRNSVQGPLLRTGHNSSFKALGETGYPVFKMAFQLREAIHRLDAGHDLARHLAVPQNDQGGDRTDWYSSFPGDVIPWNKASESEQASARQQFSEFQTAVQALSEQMSSRQNDAGGDRQVFARLLKLVVYFPDYDFVYLVDGVLVITFWGFIHATDQPRNPMHWLESSSVVAESTPALTEPPPQVEAEPEPDPVVATQPRRWRWLLWLLLALLLLALLLLLLRRCAPAALPTTHDDSPPSTQVLPQPSEHAEPETITAPPMVSEVKPDPTVTAPVVVEPRDDSERLIDHQLTDPRTTEHEIPSLTNKPLIGDDTHRLVTDPTDTTTTGLRDPALDPATTTTTELRDPRLEPATTTTGVRDPRLNPVTHPTVTAPRGKPLTLPATMPEGPATFLNGQWQINGGIQDKLTGHPLQLQYDFKQGQGSVSLRQSNGVTCSGSANGNIKQGALNITNAEKMTCSDGSSFIIPVIKCQSPTANQTDCVGNSGGDTTFPIQMLQPTSETRNE